MRVMGEQQNYSWPVQVYLRNFIESYTSFITQYDPENNPWPYDQSLSFEGCAYAIVVCSVIPILIIYPFIQKYFAKGVNMGGVKE